MFYPNVEVIDNVVHARSALWSRMVSLFAFDHTVEINPARQLVRIVSRRFWFWTTARNIPFRRIDDVATRSATTTIKGRRYLDYTIDLVLNTPRERCALLSFKDSFLVAYGLGTAEAPFQAFFDLVLKSIGKMP